MARTFSKVNLSMWQDAEFCDLPGPAQFLYLQLWTHPGLSYSGVVDWRPGRIAARTGIGWSTFDVMEAADCLEARLFIVTDAETEECLIRSWAKWDGLLKEAKLSVSWALACAKVASPDLRRVISHEANRWRKANPGWVAWTKPAVLDILAQPTLDPASRDLPRDVYAEGIRDGFTPSQGVELGVGLGVAQGVGLGVGLAPATPNGTPSGKGSGKGSVKGSPTTATTTLNTQQPSSPTPEPHQAAASVGQMKEIPRECSEHGHDRTPGCAHCITLSHLPTAKETT